ncbi:uncharacterized protein [Primulina huaijiensis]|uniref:uncharacterized protein n=1 Tax=Primulina huaijiensis TaxID=1492673 RepID=UPI003CC6E12F
MLDSQFQSLLVEFGKRMEEEFKSLRERYGRVDESGRMSKEERSMATPARSSKRGYHGTSKISNVSTYDIQCIWCLEFGHDISQCPNEEVNVLDSRVDCESKVAVECGVEVSIDVEPKVVVERIEEVGIPLISDLIIECCAVEGESLDGEFASNVCAKEEKEESSNNLLHACYDSSCTFLDQPISIVITDDQLQFNCESEKEFKMAERMSDQKSEVAIERKEKENAKEAKRREKENKLKAQKSEYERDLILYKSLQVPLYKDELYISSDDIAGSIPSSINSSLQDFGALMMRRRASVDDFGKPWDDPYDFESNQGEVRLVANATTMRYDFRPYLNSLLYRFPKLREYLANVVVKGSDVTLLLFLDCYEFETMDELHLPTMNFDVSLFTKLVEFACYNGEFIDRTTVKLGFPVLMERANDSAYKPELQVVSEQMFLGPMIWHTTSFVCDTSEMPPKRKAVEGEDSSSSRVVDEFSKLLKEQAKVHGEQIQQLLRLQNPVHGRGRGLLRQEPSSEGAYDRFKRMNPPEFVGSVDPLVAMEWVKAIEAIFDYLHFEDNDRGSCAVFLLTKTARIWWEATKVTVNVQTLQWNEFKELFYDKYFSTDVMTQKVKEFLELKQGNLNLNDYILKFEEGCLFVPFIASNDKD